jgi:hypothetical protein
MNNKNIAILPYDLITTISNFKINLLMKMVDLKMETSPALCLNV